MPGSRAPSRKAEWPAPDATTILGQRLHSCPECLRLGEPAKPGCGPAAPDMGAHPTVLFQAPEGVHTPHFTSFPLVCNGAHQMCLHECIRGKRYWARRRAQRVQTFQDSQISPPLTLLGRSGCMCTRYARDGARYYPYWPRYPHQVGVAKPILQRMKLRLREGKHLAQVAQPGSDQAVTQTRAGLPDLQT